MMESRMTDWIDINDRPPIPGERVIATDGTAVGEAWCNSAGKWYRYDTFPWFDLFEAKVTHWMPMPKPPEVTK